jgi:hypothetical protein
MPLTFVTSVYGMTNMPTDPEYWMFGITLATVCVPFFSLVGFLSTDLGYRLWMAKTKALWRWMRPKRSVKSADMFQPDPINRTLSTDEGMQKRLGHVQGDGKAQMHVRKESGAASAFPNIKRMVEATGEGKSGLSRMGTVTSSEEVREERADDRQAGWQRSPRVKENV